MFETLITLKDKFEMYVKVYGSEQKDRITKDKPTLIILHGGPGIADHTLYEKFWKKFSRTHQVLMPDLRGNGRSPSNTADTLNLTQWAEDIFSIERHVEC